ncbi:hypothetical protein CLU79DRAFT_727382 [Phycomyces nitens]|nr:hypothetical protein CLU79DRAFT_727382 [Phycomyces nitens]
MNTISSATLMTSSDNSTSSSNSSRRISQHITDIVSGNSSNRTKHHSMPPTPNPSEIKPSEMTIEIEGGHQLIIRPNRVVRGHVVLITMARIYASQIRIKFRAEETATVKVRESGLDVKVDRIDQMTTTYFELDSKVWGSETSAFSLNPWQVIEPGEHRYPFAMKFPNVNYPPSTDDPSGFSIRYIWSAHLDAPSFHPGLRSKPHVLPYRPILCAPPPEEWTFSDIVYKDKRSASGRVNAWFPKQVYCPDEAVSLTVDVECLPSDLVVTGVSFSLRKHHEGKLLLQKGTAHRSTVRTILQATVSVPGNNGSVRVPIHFQIPTRLVSPSFASRHLRVYYDLVFQIQFENPSSILKSTHTADLVVPIGIANLPHDHLLRIPDLTAVVSYENSKEAPLFFDPSLSEPPAQSGIPSELWGPLTAALATPPSASPPNYFSIPCLPPQLMRKERVERTVFTSRLVKSGVSSDMGDPIVLTDIRDEEW